MEALESQVSRLESARRDAEHKLTSMYSALRRVAGLRLDGGTAAQWRPASPAGRRPGTRGQWWGGAEGWPGSDWTAGRRLSGDRPARRGDDPAPEVSTDSSGVGGLGVDSASIPYFPHTVERPSSMPKAGKTVATFHDADRMHGFCPGIVAQCSRYFNC